MILILQIQRTRQMMEKEFVLLQGRVAAWLNYIASVLSLVLKTFTTM